MDEVVQFYNRWAPTYDQPDFMLTHERELTLSLCGPINGRRVLEVGAGTGRITTGLLSKGAIVTAIEPAVEMQNRLKEKVRDKIGAGTLTIISDSLESFIPRAQFDLVVLAMVIDHVEDVNMVFSKAKESLNDSGHLIISCVNPYYQLIVRKEMVCQDQQRNSNVSHPAPGGTIRAHCHTFGDLLDVATHHCFAWRVLREAVIDEAIVVAFPELAAQLGYPYIYSASFQLLPGS